MLSQYTQYWTIGWENDTGRIIPLPVLSRKKITSGPNECLRFEFITDTPDFVAKDRNATIILLDKDTFELDENGNKELISWRVVNQMAVADDPFPLGCVIKRVQMDMDALETPLLPNLSI